MKIQNQGFDHVEFAVSDLKTHEDIWMRLGFEKIGQRINQEQLTSVFAQGFVRILLTQVDSNQKNNLTDFQKKHGDGISVLALDVDDSVAAFEETVKKGARPAMEPQVYQTENGKVVRSEIWTPGDLRYAFIQRESSSENALFDQGLVVERLESPSPHGIRLIDHLTNNVGIGEMQTWVDWYKDIFGFGVVRHFDIRTGKTGLISDVVQSENGKIKVPINEATEPESQVQEFVDRFHGAGVQHLAFLTTDILSCVKNLRNSKYEFLQVPHTYYEAVPTRVPGVTESIEVLEDLQILLDGDDQGYLMQIFTKEIVGPFFFEFIQRKQNQGFGEGNFRALFEAIERDQIQRGVL